MAIEYAGCLIQFAKAPVPGRAKTRLHPRLGPEGAAEIAVLMTEEVSVALSGAATSGWHRVLCVDDAEHPFVRSLSARNGQELWEQGRGDLGERMARACGRALQYFPAVIVVGSDCLGYDAAYLSFAMRLLGSGVQAVLGPAIDGGYVLIGLRSCPPGLFDGVAWGGPDVASAQRKRLRACGIDWQELPPRADADRPGDLWMTAGLKAVQA